MAFDGFSGDESGLLAVGAGLAQIDGTGFSISSTQKKSGVYAYRLQPNGAASRLHQSVSSRSIASMHVAVYFATAPGSPCNFYMGFRPLVNSGNIYAVIFNEFNNFYAQAGGGTPAPNFAYSTGQWYVIDMYVDVSGTTHTVAWYMNGTRQTDATWSGQSATTLTECVLGHDTLTPSGDIYLDDWLWGTASGDVPFDVTGFTAYAVNAEGTHALDASPSQFFFKHDGTTLAAITNGDTSYQDIDEVPLASDAARVLIKSASGGGGTDTNIAPTSIEAQSGWSTTVTAIDEDPDTPGTDWATAPDNNTTCSVRVGFPTPSGNPTGNITVDVYVRKNAASGSGTPTCEIDLYENGTLVASGSAQSVTSTTGQKLSQTFSSYTLSDPTGAGLEVLVTGSASGGNPNSRSSVDLNAVNIASLVYSTILVPTTSEYIEYGFADEATQTGIKGVLAIIAADQDSAATALYVTKLFDSLQGTNVEDIYNDSAFNVGTTKTYKSKLFTQRPNSGGSWTQAALNGLRLRFGYTNNPAGNIRLEGAIVIGYFGSPVSTNYTESATVSGKSSVSASEIYTPNGGTAYTEAATVKSVTSIVAPSVSFPTTPILDNFNLADQGPPPDSNWLGSTFSTDNGLVIVSNQVAHATGTGAGGSALYNADYVDGIEFRLDMPVNVACGIDYFVTNGGTATPSGYRAQISETNNELQLYVFTNGAFTKLAGYALTIADGDSVGIKSSGGVHQLMYKAAGSVSWIPYGAPVNDSTYSAGKAGIFMSASSTGRVDNFGGGQIPLQEFVGFIESATVSGRTTVSSSEVYTPASGTAYTDSATVSSKTTPSAIETDASVDSGTAATKSNISVSDLYATNDSSSVSSATSPTGSDIRSSVESGTVATASQPSIADIQASTISAIVPGVTTPVLVESRDRIDSATVPSATVPSVVDIAAYVDTSSISTVSSPSVVDIEASFDSATTNSATTPSIIDISAYVDGTTTQSLTSVSSIEVPPQKLDSATCSSVTTPSIIEFANYVDASLLTSTSNPNITEAHEIPDSAIISSKSTPTLADVANYVDQSTQTSATTPISTSELFAGLDSNTIPGATVVLTNELAAYVDSAAPQNITTPSITDTYIPAPQRLKPISNVAAGDWQPSDGTSQLYALVSDDNDTTYIYSTAT